MAIISLDSDLCFPRISFKIFKDFSFPVENKMKYYLLLTSVLASCIVVNCMEDGGDPSRRGKFTDPGNRMTEMFHCFMLDC